MFWVGPKGVTIFDERNYEVEITDEGGGEFVLVRQSTSLGCSVLRIDPREWDDLRDVIDRMMRDCRDEVEQDSPGPSCDGPVTPRPFLDPSNRPDVS